MATARKGRELFTILETSADAESSTVCDSQDSPLNLSADVKWFEIPYRKPDSDEEDEEDDDDDDEEVREEEDDGGGGGGGDGGEGENGFASAAEETEEAADAAGFVAGGGCNIILVTGSNGIQHDEEEYAEDCYYSTSTNCSDTASNDSDIDFSDFEEEEHRSFFSFEEDSDSDCTSADFWGEPDQLTQYLQLCDRETEPVRGERGYDALFKIRHLLDVVENTMWDAYTPNRCLTIDKSAIVMKGRFSPTQYMPSKPLSRGLTVWMLCDSRSGYCHRAKMYIGKPGEDEVAASLGHRVVTSLVRGLERQYHHLFMDGFFTSVPLLQRLLRDGLYACGPTQPGRKGYPEVLRPRNVGKLSQGEFYQCQRGNLVATVTRDVKVVTCLSTNSAPGIVGISPGRQPPDADGEQGEGDGGVNCSSSSSSGGVAFGVPRPLPLLLYQENMKGVDLCDQLRECYQVGRPCKKWWRYFLWFYVNLCIVDAYVILRESRGGAPPPGFNGKQFTQRHFRVRLAQQLIGDYQGARGMERAARKRHADSPIEYGHRLERMSERSRRCRNCTNKGLRHESVFGCKICNVHLCRGGCFSEFHK
ncbi:PiggyBac transposable element-derived protein 4 [Liparis tanakae]|uniref:PiggyBac transposable element-derived protein 4 n=1 Tax=Liparis tanakae TaxID=230148 RepID=A0A4Z2EI03_9TELE|nr:PiggyBac transposable element-derived protein 4 [Liparis tanakae]